MKKLTIDLTAEEYEELESLEEGQQIEVEYKGIPAFIYLDEYGNVEYKGRKYTFNFFCPAEAKFRVEKKEEPKETKSTTKNSKTILATEFDPKKYHLYEVKTTGKHPVHLIDAGGLLTEDDGDYGDLDMYWFWLNQREYDLFKSNLHEVEVQL